MTPDEQRMLSDLADKIAKTPPPPKDPAAEDFIRTRIGNRPDALYVMTQTVLIQNMALDQAQRQIQELQQQRPAQPSYGGGSFLGQSQPAAQNYAAPPPQYAAAPQYAPAPSGAPSFLRGAAQTAAGVAAGALAFEGIRSLFDHPGYGGEGHGFGGGFGGDRPVEETVVNNYYDNDRGASGNDDLELRDQRDSFASSDDTDDSSSSDDDTGGYDDSGSGDDFS